ncbi:DUF4129 domain-containing protein [Gracilibacillus oryzae]|uniref:DUF4129 domain-containing protein n=1 Tax=Gracilibacillus oryzae TaxID=1672701 RepID=A0A7C8GTU8_9BACI|nr:DUF4129 domain-containing protein [Gracilibacillus oryzae]KAB8137868.1 DUF4129 domain-containing protein [Gracilibacillus oryzae]
MKGLEGNQSRLEEILSRREYQIYYEDNRGLLEILWDAISGWINDLLAEIFDSFVPGSGVGNTIVVIIVACIIAAIITGIFFSVRYFARKKHSKHTLLHTTREMEWRYTEHLKEAERLAQLQQYKLATRHQFLALLLLLHERKQLEAKLWKTNWDYYDELKKADSQLAEGFYEAATFFERVMYGEQEVIDSDFHHVKEKVNHWIMKIEQQAAAQKAGDNG